MGDRGQEAIHAAGRVIEPARRTSISQPSVSSWSTVPTGRVLSVEAVMDVARAILRPDSCGEQPGEIDDVDAARAQEYALLAMLLARAPDAAILGRIAKLRGDATPLGLAHVALAQAADNASAEKIEREFFNLFIGVGRGELLPYGSYYLTGFLNERPLARLREDLRALGIERAEGQVEPEDHAAILCEIMAGLAGGQFATAAGLQQQFFEKHLAPWIGRFFADLERAKAADFYRHAGTVGRLFIETSPTRRPSSTCITFTPRWCGGPPTNSGAGPPASICGARRCSSTAWSAAPPPPMRCSPSPRRNGDHFETLGARAVHVVPNGVDCAAYQGLPDRPSVGAADPALPRRHVVGAERRRGGVPGDRVLPRVRASVPGRAALLVVGRDPTTAIKALGLRPGVEVTGSVPDVIPYLREASVLAVPLEAGGGTRLKILEAFAAGLPVVSTPVGCEGSAQSTTASTSSSSRRDGFADGDRGPAPRRAARARGSPRHRAAICSWAARYDWGTVGGRGLLRRRRGTRPRPRAFDAVRPAPPTLAAPVL